MWTYTKPKAGALEQGVSRVLAFDFKSIPSFIFIFKNIPLIAKGFYKMKEAANAYTLES
jgi:uncharacterized membrane-anchored protein YitT (DUF2179 family)